MCFRGIGEKKSRLKFSTPIQGQKAPYTHYTHHRHQPLMTMAHLLGWGLAPAVARAEVVHVPDQPRHRIDLVLRRRQVERGAPVVVAHIKVNLLAAQENFFFRGCQKMMRMSGIIRTTVAKKPRTHT